MPSIENALTVLRGAVLNSRIYPAGSSIVQSIVASAHQALSECLEETPVITINDQNQKLWLHNKTELRAPGLRAMLVQHAIQILKFRKGMTPQELEVLVMALAQSKPGAETRGRLPDWLAAQGVTHIEANEVEYVAIAKGDEVAGQIRRLLSEKNDKLSSVLSFLEKSIEHLGNIGDRDARETAQQQIIGKIAELPPKLLEEFFETSVSHARGETAIREGVLRSLSTDKLTAVLDEVERSCRERPPQDLTPQQLAEKAGNLKRFIAMLMESPVSQTVPFHYYEELLKLGLLDRVPTGMVKGNEPYSLTAQVDYLLTLPRRSLLEASIQTKVPDLLKLLCGMDAEGPLERFVGAMLENLKDDQPSNRAAAVKSLRTFQTAFIHHQKDAQTERVLEVITPMIEIEPTLAVYSELVSNMVASVAAYFTAGRFAEAARLLTLLRRHALEERPGSPWRPGAAAKGLADFSAASIDVLCADLNSKDQDRYAGAYRIIPILDETAAGPLIEGIKRGDDLRTRQAAAAALSRLGPAATSQAVAALEVGLPEEVLLRILSVVGDAPGTELVPKVLRLMQHPAGAVRRQAVRMLARSGDPQAQGALADALRDPDAAVQLECVRSIKEFRLRNLTPELLKHALSVPPAVQEEIAIILGEWKDYTGLPCLVRLLEPKRFRWGNPRAPEALRLRCLWAIGQLFPHPDAVKAVKKSAVDSSPAIRHLAAKILTPSKI